MKHFNQGNVWGRVSEVKKSYSEGKGTPYLAVTLECPNEMYGNVRTYGRLWGDDKINAFMDHFKSHPGQAYRFQGFFSQYEKEESRKTGSSEERKRGRYSNYTFFTWQAVEVKEFRAAFVLTGELTAAQIVDGDGKLFLNLTREGQNGYRDIEEDFEVWTLNTQEIAGLTEGEIVQVKGVLRYREPEDYFGGTPEGTVRPYVMALKVMTPKEETDVEVF